MVNITQKSRHNEHWKSFWENAVTAHSLLQSWTELAPYRNPCLVSWSYCSTPCENSWDRNWDFMFQLLQRLTLWKGLAFSGPGPGLPQRLPKKSLFYRELKWRALQRGKAQSKQFRKKGKRFTKMQSQMNTHLPRAGWHRLTTSGQQFLVSI